MTRLPRRLAERLRRLWGRAATFLVFRPWLLAGTVSEGDEVPDHLPARRAVVVGARSGWKWLVFDCPCRTGHRIMLNLDPDRRPYWNLRVSSTRRLTVSPSIDYRGNGLSCHYFIRDGRVVWFRRTRRLMSFRGEQRNERDN